MLQNLTGWHALIILAIVLLIFGAAKLPALAKSVGQSVRILKTEVTEDAAAAAPVPRGSTDVTAQSAPTVSAPDTATITPLPAVRST